MLLDGIKVKKFYLHDLDTLTVPSMQYIFEMESLENISPSSVSNYIMIYQ